MNADPRFTPTPFVPSWPIPDARLLRPELPAAPVLPLRDVLGPSLAQWVADVAERVNDFETVGF
jgi:hypothetical protein